jgi:SAM-dependent methyltransferase
MRGRGMTVIMRAGPAKVGRREGSEMPFEDVMMTVNRWLVATDALAAVGAELSLYATGAGDPDVVRALQGVSAAAGLTDLENLAPPQRDIVIALVRMALHQAADLVDDPARPIGWSFNDPAILEGWGRGSMLVPGAIAAGAPELADVKSFLDVGVGVGLLAIAAAGVWPNAAIVGVDIWKPSLALAIDNVARAGLDNRITIREQDVTALDDTDRYDCAWLPTFFFTEAKLELATRAVFRSVQPGGSLVLARMAAPPDPLAEATGTVRVVRAGGTPFETKQLTDALTTIGCTDVRVLPRQGPAPLEYVIGRRPNE